MKQTEKEICLKKLYYFRIEINKNAKPCLERIESDEDNYEESEVERNLIFKQSDCSRVFIKSYEFANNPDQKNSSRKDPNHEDEDYKIEFCEEYTKNYLVNHESKIEGEYSKYLQNLITFKTESGEKEETVTLEDDQLLYCQSDNLDELIQLISKSYKRIVNEEDDKNNFRNDIAQLEGMKDIFNRGQYSYFVIEKIVFKRYGQNVDGMTYTYNIPSVSGDDIQKKIFTIVASSDYEFKKHLHILHKHDKLSAYSVQKTVEQRMNTIIYRSFKDIIRLCNYRVKLQDTEKYSNFYNILNCKRSNKESFFLLKDDKRISLKEIKSIVYKNACIEGLFPFNIYLNTFKESIIWNKLKWLVGKLLSDNSYKLTHHLSTQVGNLFYSYNDSGIFQIYKMQQKERSVSRNNDFTKIRVLDFFPLDQQIDEISEYIFHRLDYFDEQLHYFFTPDEYIRYQIDGEIEELMNIIADIKQQLGIDNENLNVPQNNEKLANLILDCEKILQHIGKFKICNLIKGNFQEFINKVREIITPIQEGDVSKVEEYTEIYDNYEEDSYLVNVLCKTFLKFILTNNQVNRCYIDKIKKKKDHPNQFEDDDDDVIYYFFNFQNMQNNFYIIILILKDEEEKKDKDFECVTGNDKGDGGVYTLLLRRLGYQFLSHYFGQFKYFHSWPIILIDTEIKKYKLLENNCQTSGISFAYQIKELLKGFIEPLFIPEQHEFFQYYKNHFNEQNANQKLNHVFQSVESKSDISQSYNYASIKSSQQNQIEQNSISQSQEQSIHFSLKHSGQESKLSLQNSRPNRKFQIVLHNKYKEYYFKSLIENFSKYSSKTNMILNKSIYPLVLEKPLPYHQFYGEKMAYEYLNAIISKDDYILQVYKIIVKDFPESLELLERIKTISFSVLGNDIIQKNQAFQVITSEAYNYIFSKPKPNIPQENKDQKSEETYKSHSQDFLSTLFMIYDALYFMRNKTYHENINQGGMNGVSGKVGSNQKSYDLEQHYNNKENQNNSCSNISQKEKSTISEQKIFDTEKKKYFSSFTRHDNKDFFKELAFYYYNSIRMKHSTFTSRQRLSYIGFLLIKDPKKKYLVK